MDAYIVSLKTASDRKKYMTSLLSSEKSITINWIEAVDGRVFSDDEIDEKFDCKKFRQHYLKNPKPGEIGCTLSHQKCYNKLLQSSSKSVLILEDDIVLNDNIRDIIPKIENILNTNKPIIILLSGWFWYLTKKEFDNNRQLCKVCDGYLTHAYAINREAAQLMIEKKPYMLADAWELFIKKGVKIFGLTPHPIDQDWSGVFKSDVLTNATPSKTFVLKSWIYHKQRGVKQRFFKLIGHFEAPRNMSTRVDEIKDALN